MVEKSELLEEIFLSLDSLRKKMEMIYWFPLELIHSYFWMKQ